MSHRAVVLIWVLGGAVACGPFDDVGDCEPTCAGDTVCADITCVPAFPRSYRFELGVSLQEQDPNGDCWDEPLCGSPDPYALLKVDGVQIGRTPEAGSSFSHVWSDEAITVTLDATSAVELVAYDADVDFDDLAARCAATPLTAARIRTGRMSCDEAGASSVFANITLAP